MVKATQKRRPNGFDTNELEVRPRSGSVRVRLFKHADGPRVREIFALGIGRGPGSSRRSALTGSLTRPNMLATYLTFALGLAISYLYWSQTAPLGTAMGGALCSAAAAFFLLHLWTLDRVFRAHASPHRHVDMFDICTHYNLDGGNGTGDPYARGQDGFWVAELVGEGGMAEIVGCIGLDTSTMEGPGTADLRRMAVALNMQRRGIGSMLLETVLTHARAKGLKTIRVTTTAYQRSAVGIYETFGWRRRARSHMEDRFGPWWLDAQIVDWHLELGGG